MDRATQRLRSLKDEADNCSWAVAVWGLVAATIALA